MYAKQYTYVYGTSHVYRTVLLCVAVLAHWLIQTVRVEFCNMFAFPHCCTLYVQYMPYTIVHTSPCLWPLTPALNILPESVVFPAGWWQNFGIQPRALRHKQTTFDSDSRGCLMLTKRGISVDDCIIT